MFLHLEPYAGDPILGLNEAFQTDPRPHKINVSIGIYFDDEGRIPVLDCVREAEARLLAGTAPKSYLPIEGSPAMRQAVQNLLFGAEHAVVREGRVATLQTVGASGALRVAADFLKRWLPGSAVWVSDPSWDNHRAMFEGAGVTVNTYPYYDAATGGLDFDAMMATLATVPPKSVVLLHACCHNPTGVDLTAAQWRTLVPLLQARQLLPFLDLAYQGFGDGIDEDADAVRLLASSGITFIVGNSFSKSMSIYGERAGALSVVCGSADEADLVLGQMKATVRRNYSSPSIHAAGIVSLVLGDPALRASWMRDVAAMRVRIKAMRERLHGVLSKRLPQRNFDYFLTQRGMFSYTGLTPVQVDALKQVHAVYLVRSGRMCVAGLTTRNVDAVAAAFVAVLD